MKTLLFFLLFPFAVNAQQFIEVTNFNNGTVTKQLINVSALFPATTSNGGVSKGYVDSGDARISLAIQSAVNNLQTLIANNKGPKGDKGDKGDTGPQGPAGSGGTGSGGKLTFTGDGLFAEVFPANYNPALKQPKFNFGVQEFKGVNGADPRSNVVVSMGWNINSGAGEEIIGEGTFRDAWESHYVVGGVVYERHVGAFTPKGSPQLGEIRPLSFYESQSSGEVAVNSRSEQWNFKLTKNSDYDWMSFGVDNGGNASITINPPGTGNGEIFFPKAGAYITTSPNGYMNFITNSVFSFNKPISGRDGGGLDFVFNGNGTDNKVSFINGNGGVYVFQISKDGLLLNGKKVIVDANGFLKVQQ